MDPSVPELFFKARRPFEDTLRVLGVKDVDAYLPTIEEAAKVFAAKAQQGPSPEVQEQQTKAELNKAKSGEAMAHAGLMAKQAQDIDVDNMFETIAAKRGKLSAVEID